MENDGFVHLMLSTSLIPICGETSEDVQASIYMKYVDCPKCFELYYKESPPPHEVLGVSKEEFDKKVAEAEARGTTTCPNCGHVQYRQTKPWFCGFCYVPQHDVAENLGSDS